MLDLAFGLTDTYVWGGGRGRVRRADCGGVGEQRGERGRWEGLDMLNLAFGLTDTYVWVGREERGGGGGRGGGELRGGRGEEGGGDEPFALPSFSGLGWGVRSSITSPPSAPNFPPGSQVSAGMSGHHLKRDRRHPRAHPFGQPQLLRECGGGGASGQRGGLGKRGVIGHVAHMGQERFRITSPMEDVSELGFFSQGCLFGSTC